MENTIDLSQFTTEQLENILAEKKNEGKKMQEKIEASLKKDKEDFLEATVRKFSAVSHDLEALKNFTITEANKLNLAMYNIQGKEPKEVKTFSLKCDKYKVTVEMQERFEFTEEANVHLQTIKELFKEKFADRNKGFYNFLESILMRNSKGEFDAKLLVKGRREVIKIGDAQLINEFEKLEKCQRVVGSSLYCRVYEKDEHQKWNDINVQFSSL